MWAAKARGEGAHLVRACKALCEAMKEVEVAFDSTKESFPVTDEANSFLFY